MNTTSPRVLLQRIALCAAGMIVIPAFGQSAGDSTTPSDKEKALVLPTFSVTTETDSRFTSAQTLTLTRTATDIADIPQSVSVINKSYIEAMAPLSLNEMVQYVAGGQVGNVPSISLIQRFMLRGFSSQGDIVDGFWMGSGGPSTMEFIDHIEIVKGPSAIMSTASTGAVGGAVNKVSVSPTQAQVDTVTVAKGRYGLGTVTLDVGGALTKDKKLLWRFVGTQSDDQEGYYDYSYLRQTNVMPMLLYNFSENTEVWVKYQFLDQYASSYNGIVLDGRTMQPIDVSHSTSFGEPSPGNWRSDRVKRLWAQFTTRPNDHVAIRFAASDNFHQLLSTESIMSPSGTTSPTQLPDGSWTYVPYVQYNVPPNYVPGTLLPRSTTALLSLNGSRVFQNDYAFTFDTGKVSHKLLVGAALTDFPLSSRSWSGTGSVAFSSPIDPFAPRTPGTVVANFSTPPVADQETSQTYAKLFVLETAGFLNDRLLLSYGLSRHRFESSSATYTFNQITNTAGATTTVPAKTLYKNLVQFGVVVKPVKNVSVFYGQNSNFAANPIQNGEYLPPQLGKQNETGIKADLSDRVKISVSYFEIHQLNNTVPASPKTTPQTVVLIAGQTSRGFDGDFEFNLTKNIDIVGSFSLFDTRVQAGLPYNLTPMPYDGKLYNTIPVNNASEHNFSMLARYNFRDGRLKGLALGVSTTSLGKRAITDNSNQILFGYLPGYTLVNLMASYETKHFRYQVNLDNVFDKSYWFSSRNQLNIDPGTPFNPHASITYRF
ncbi:MAG: TonB-dependent receptor plug domain-containing protein [Lacunisphaera sp.]